MSTYTRRRHSPQGQYNIAGKRRDNVCTQAQHGVVPSRRANGVDQPFPNKPVSHRRPVNPRTQDSLDLYDFEKIAISKQPRGPLSPQEHHPNGTRETADSQHPRKDSHRLPSRELQMARAIHAKELMLQEKLWRAEEKIRQKIKRDSVDAAASDDRKSEEERHDTRRAERGKARTKSRMSEQQRREPVRSREMMMQGRRQEDVKQLEKRRDQRSEDRMRNTHEEERATWKRREVVRSPQSQRNRGKGTQERKKIMAFGGETGVKSQDGTEEAKEAKNKGWTRKKKYMERTCKEMYSSDDERDMPQMSQQKTSHRAATENHRRAGKTPSGEPRLPPVSSPSHSSRPEQGELRLTESPGTGLQLLPCRLCNRTYASERLEKHVQICKKVKQSHRQVFNSYINRTKGSAIEEFWKTHSRAKTPEVGQ